MTIKNPILKTIIVTLGSILLSLAITYSLCMIWGENQVISTNYTLLISVIAPLIIVPIVRGFFINLNNKLNKTAELLKDEIHWRRLLIEESKDAIVILDQNVKVYEANSRFSDMLGYSREDVYQLHAWDWDVHFNQERILEMSQAVNENGQHFETQHRCKDGRIIDVELSNNGVVYRGQKLIFCICRDISERKKAEKEREDLIREHRNSLDKLRSIYDAAPVGIGVVVDNVFQDINEHYCQMIGYSRDELIGQHVKLVHHFDETSYAKYSEIIEDIKSRGAAVYEVKHKRKDGQLIDIMLGFAPITPSSLSDGITFIALDISERKRLETTLIESEEKYRRFFENDITGDILLTADRNIIDCNPAFARMFGYGSVDEIIGVNADTLYSYDKGKKLLDRLRKEKKIEGIQLEFIHRDNHPLHCIGNLVGHFDGEGNMTHVSGYYFDDTKRVLLEKDLRKAHKMEAIGTLAGGIAHDFNNLLQPILGYTEFLLDDLPADSLQRKYVDKIINAGMRAKDLVKQILAFSRQSPHETVAVRLQKILKDVVSLCRSTIPSNIEIHYDFQKDCPVVMADPTQLHQVAMNLVINAYHAIDQTVGKISVQVKETVVGEEIFKLTPLKPGRYALLSVSDTGCGMDDGTIEKIFEPYFTTKEQGKGTGLGLAVVYGIVKDCNGEINVYSEVGKGTTFNVYLPVAQDLVQDTESRKPELYQGGQERVLLVDDEKIVLELVEGMLSRLGYRVTPVQNSTEALAAFKAAPEAFDLVITDMTMPEMTGDQLAERVLEISPNMPIILCTGFSERIGGERARKIGVKDFLMKPISISEVSRKVRQVLD